MSLLTHRFVSPKIDGIDPTQVRASNWNDDHVFGGGATGALLVRDASVANYGASWLAAVASGSVLVSNGVGALPVWTDSATFVADLVDGLAPSFAAVEVASAGAVSWLNRAVFTSPADGVLLARNAAGTGFTRFAFGGTSGSFPALQRNGAALDIELADGSGLANLRAAVGTFTDLFATGDLDVTGALTVGSFSVADLGITTGTVTQNGLGTPAYTIDEAGLILQNTTAGTSGTKLQAPPHLRFIWHAYDDDTNSPIINRDVDFERHLIIAIEPTHVEFFAPPFAEDRPADILHLYTNIPDLDGSTLFEPLRLQLNGNLLIASGMDIGMGASFDPYDDDNAGDMSFPAESSFYWRTRASVDGNSVQDGNPYLARAALRSPATGILQLFPNDDNPPISIVELNIGNAKPTIASGFSDGVNLPTMGADSTNVCGYLTVGTTGSPNTGLINFGAPAWKKTPVCVAASITATPGDVRQMACAASTTQLRITTTAGGWPSGQIIMWHCFAPD